MTTHSQNSRRFSRTSSWNDTLSPSVARHESSVITALPVLASVRAQRRGQDAPAERLPSENLAHCFCRHPSSDSAWDTGIPSIPCSRRHRRVGPALCCGRASIASVHGPVGYNRCPQLNTLGECGCCHLASSCLVSPRCFSHLARPGPRCVSPEALLAACTVLMASMLCAARTRLLPSST